MQNHKTNRKLPKNKVASKTKSKVEKIIIDNKKELSAEGKLHLSSFFLIYINNVRITTYYIRIKANQHNDIRI